VRRLMHQSADLPVRRAVGHDDFMARGVAPAARAVVGEVADLDGVAELGGVSDQWGGQVVVSCARDRLRRRHQRDRLLPRQSVGHRDIEDRHGSEEHLLLAGLLAVLVALLDGDGGEDADRGLAFADAAVEVEERAEAGDIGRREPARVTDHADDALVVEAGAREPVTGTDLDPALPAVGG
jgi:hypothetical protein